MNQQTIKGKFQPSCTVTQCGVVDELMSTRKREDAYVKEIDNLRSKYKELELKFKALSQKNDKELPKYETEKFYMEYLELMNKVPFLQKELEDERTISGKAKLEYESLKAQYDAEKAKVKEIMSYADADDKLKEQKRLIIQHTIEIERLSAKKEGLDRQVKLLDDKLEDLKVEHNKQLAYIEEYEKWIFNAQGFAKGIIGKKPIPPPKHEGIKIEQPRKELPSFLRRILRLQ